MVVPQIVTIWFLSMIAFRAVSYAIHWHCTHEISNLKDHHVTVTVLTFIPNGLAYMSMIFLLAYIVACGLSVIWFFVLYFIEKRKLGDEHGWILFRERCTMLWNNGLTG